MKRILFSLTTLLTALTIPVNAGVSVDGGPETKEAVFFSFDDHAIPWRNNVFVTPVTATKHPDNPVLRRGPEGAPDHGHAILYGTVMKLDGKFRMWYLGMFETEVKSGQAPGWWRPMCYAESDDGITWTKPDLGLVDFNGNKKNNICLIESEVPSLAKVNDFLSILHEPEDPDPSRRFKCVYIAHPEFADVRGGRSGIGPDERRWGAFIAATSADGLSWKVVGDRPMNAGNERFEVSGLYKWGNFYHAPGQLISPWTWRMDGSDVGRVTLTYRSPDFDHWSDSKAFALARPGQLTSSPIKGQQGHMGAGLWNRGNVIVGLNGLWQDAPEKPAEGKNWNDGVRIDLGLVLSNNGIQFREPIPDHKVIPHGKPGEWDDIAILQGHAFVNEGDQTMIWYSHWDTSANLKNMEIGLATLRRDGFGYLSQKVPDSSAHFETAPFEGTNPSKVFLNVEGVSAEHPITVQLLDEFARPVKGSLARVTSSGTRVEVPFSQEVPAGKTFALRVELPTTGDAKLYALYVAE
ncbi:MAG: hypothetical protein KBF76_16040 [Verrucomicrobiales bacterium]|nr:hypothetical protein [Verrucomicrobiales bacterium]